MASLFSTDQFIALEAWVEACMACAAQNFSEASKVKRHRARQRAFTLMTGIEAPLIDAQPEPSPKDDSDLA